MKVKKYITYAKKCFVMIKIRKVNIPFIIKSETIATIATTPENFEEPLIIFAI